MRNGGEDPVARADAAQKRAANPAVSAWVTASAGTGKTKVLTDRVLRLLLAGADPAKILCLTYTKAAAAEMENRITGALARWAVAETADLTDALGKLTGAAPEAEMTRQARRLFAKVLDTPGGLKIETIHGFCQSILKRFPLEAQVSPHFTVIEEHDAAELRNEALQRVLRRTQREASGPLAEALATVTALVSEQQFVDVLNAMLAKRGKLEAALADGQGDPAVLERRIYDLLGARQGETEADLTAAAVAEATKHEPTLRKLAAVMLSAGTNMQKRGQPLADWLELDAAGRSARFEEYRRVFLTGDGEPYKRMLDKAPAEAFPDGIPFMEAEAERLVELDRRKAALTTARASAALAHFAGAVLAVYDSEKAATAQLDFDDLIAKTRRLLDSTQAAWVLYKLDGGLDHILIDEAQDTSPEQWELIDKLTDEFFAGQGIDRPEASVERTIFAVGDYKQSIYRFQGANPEKFREMREVFRAKVEGAGQPFEPVALDVSFRSTEGVLEGVDAVFNQPALAPGIREPEEALEHRASRTGERGTVTVWPVLPPAEKPELGVWEMPLPEAAPAPAPQRAVAEGIARTIGNWLADGSLLVWDETPGKARVQRPVTAGDIMVLVRRRTDFIEHLVSELKTRNIDVAGVDRMILPEQLAVKDLLALARFLLLPDDDLSLAEVLRGPLVDFSDDDLYAVAYGRGGKSLWRALRDAAAGDGAPFAAAAESLAHLLSEVDYLPPYDLFAEVLEARGGRTKLIKRLGREAEDPVDEFLALALTYQRLHPPSLQGFVHWVTAGESEVKRDLEQARPSEVRIMTVHGAKGLQAPVVILPDTHTVPAEFGREPVLWHRGKGLPLWAPKKEDHDPVTLAERRAYHAREIEEHRRLLYVAMTRAADHLVVCSWHDKEKDPEPDTWYGAVTAGLGDIAGTEAVEIAEGWGGAALVLDRGADGAPAEMQPDLGLPEPVLQRWMTEPAPAEPRPPAPLAPSRPEEPEPAVASPIGHGRLEETIRFRRGLLIHRLLQSLPDVPPGERRGAAERYLAKEGVAKAEIGPLSDEVMAVLETPDFAPLFAEGSIAEVPLTGLLGTQVVCGQIDRLAVTDDAVLIVDYKSNRPPPADEAGVAPLYLRQMAAYRDLLRQIYASRTVRCALLWTDGPRLMPLSDGALDRHAIS